MTSEHWILSIFCDDIRPELSGKVSAMGIYHGFIGLQTPVQTLPRLCILTFLNTIHTSEPADIKVNVLSGADTELMPPFKVRMPIGHGLPPQITKGSPLTVPIELQNCELKDGMSLSVLVTVNGELLRSHDLPVIHVPQVAMTAPTMA